MEEQNNVQEPVKKKGGTVKLVLIVALIAAIAGGAGMYFLLENKDKENNSENTSDDVIANEIVENNTIEDDKNDGSFLSGLFGNKNEENNTIDTNTAVDDMTTEPETYNTTPVNTKESTIENPLTFGEWGAVPKYVSSYLSAKYKETNYIDVPVSVTKVVRGDEAETIFKEWCDASSFYTYQEPKTNMEWAVVTYKVDLAGLTFDEGTIGTDYDIYSSIKGTDGGTLKYNDVTYILTTTDITSNEYVKEPKIYEGQFVVQLPVGCTDYIIKMGDEYNGKVSYFKGQ